MTVTDTHLPPTPPEQVTSERRATCPICEAACGLRVTVADDGRTVLGVRGDNDHPRTRGFICPKGVALKELHHDPDRLRQPLLRRDGELVEVSWPEAFARLADLLGPVVRTHGPDAVAFHLGNPLAHDYGSWIYGWHALKLFGARQVYTTATVDHMPMMTAAAYMFGAGTRPRSPSRSPTSTTATSSSSWGATRWSPTPPASPHRADGSATSSSAAAASS